MDMTIAGYLTPEVLTELGGHTTAHVTIHVTFSRGILSLLFTILLNNYVPLRLKKIHI